MRRSVWRAWATVLATIAFMVGVVGAPASALAATLAVTFEMIGPDNAVWVPETTVQVEEGTTAAELTLEQAPLFGVTANTSTSSWGLSFDSFAKGDSGDIGWDATTEKYWQLFIDGASSWYGADSVTLTDGMAVTWFYSKYGDELPEISDDGNDGDVGEGDEFLTVDTNVDTAHPDVSALWPTYTGAAWSISGSTPVATGALAWKTQLADPADWSTYLSDPVAVAGKLWLAHGSKLLVVNASTGAVEQTVALNAAIDSAARLTYADGFVLVPLNGGSIQAVSATTFETAWVSEAVAEGSQNLSPIAVHDGIAWISTCVASWTGPATDGVLAGVDVATGDVVAKMTNPRGYGYYWAGLATDTGVAGVGVIGDDGGTLASIDLSTGKELHTLAIGTAIRSTPVKSGGVLVFTTTDGVLHRVAVGADGSLSETGSVAFASSSTSTPAVMSDGTVAVGGSVSGDSGWHGRLAIVDVESMTVSQKFDQADGADLPGDVKSYPLVNGTRVWFTSNGEPGSLYVADVSDGTCRTAYAPEGDGANWCMASVVPTADGTLVYKNDSGYLFCVKAASTADDNGAYSGEPSDKNNGTVGESTKQPVANNIEEAGNNETDNGRVGGAGNLLSANEMAQKVAQLSNIVTNAATGESTDEATPIDAEPESETEDAGVPVIISDVEGDAIVEEPDENAVIWPIACIVGGLALLAVVLLWKRRDKGANRG